MIDTIYLDMDGVIADFDKHYSSIYGCNCRDDPNKHNWYDFVDDTLVDPTYWGKNQGCAFVTGSTCTYTPE
jgi:hypothetical protein